VSLPLQPTTTTTATTITTTINITTSNSYFSARLSG
jgi:hypothetical protein